jgi:hypothetical protein
MNRGNLPVDNHHAEEGSHPVEDTHAVVGMPQVEGGKPLVEEDRPQVEAGTPLAVAGSLAEGIPGAGTHGCLRQHHALCLRRAPCHPHQGCPCLLPLSPQAT